MDRSIFTSGGERFFSPEDIIVSKTNLKGTITYSNTVFQQVSGYSAAELMGAPHSIVRHAAMPRCVFKLLWDTIEQKQEIFAYVLNRAKNGDRYWVLAHVTPSYAYDEDGAETDEVVGYHSTRRVPDRAIVDDVIIPLYASLLEEEARHPNRKDGMNASTAMLVDLLNSKNVTYEQLICSLMPQAAA